MGEKTLSFSEGIIATRTSDINDERADERPVSGSIIVPKGSGIFPKDDIFNPMQTIFNPPVFANPYVQIQTPK